MIKHVLELLFWLLALQHKGGKRKHLNILGSLANRVDKAWKTVSCFCRIQNPNLASIARV
jgi:hypothetical protein